MQFERAVLIVEAKRWDGSQQPNFEQWAREIRARPPQHSHQRLLLLALGGLPEYDVRHVSTLKHKAVESEAFTLPSADYKLLILTYWPLRGASSPLLFKNSSSITACQHQTGSF